MPGSKITTERKAQVAAAVLVDGASTRQAAAAAGVSQSTAARVAEQVRTGTADPDLVRIVEAHRKQMVPIYGALMRLAVKHLAEKIPTMHGDRLTYAIEVLDRLQERGVMPVNAAAQDVAAGEARAAGARARLFALIDGGRGGPGGGGAHASQPGGSGEDSPAPGDSGGAA